MGRRGKLPGGGAGEHCGGKEVCGSQRTQLLRIFRKTSLSRWEDTEPSCLTLGTGGTGVRVPVRAAVAPRRAARVPVWLSGTPRGAGC